MVSDVIKTTKKNLKKNNIIRLNDVYNSKKKIVAFSAKMKKFDHQIKNFLRKKMYFHQKVNSKTNLGRKIITKLFNKISKNQKRYVSIKKYNSKNLERNVCDYIAGMTDRYAINLYNKL